MQGGRSVIGSLSESSLDFDHGSSSSNSVIDARIHWVSMMNHGELDTQGYLRPPGVSGYERPITNKWNSGESSSSTRPNEMSKHDERVSEHGWLSLLASSSSGMGPRLQNWQHDPNPMFLLNNGNVHSNANQILNGSLFLQNSISDGALPNHNLDAGSVGHVEDHSQVVEYPMQDSFLINMNV